jgi:predicted metal-dependent phosphoesterase TrpH
MTETHECLYADLHIHSKYSDDGCMSVKRILRLAKKVGLNTIAITDHNTIRGAIEAKHYEQAIGIKVIIGTEIATDIGDIIGLNITEDIISRDWLNVINEIRQQNGIVVLPHPYRSHKNVEEVAQQVDMIEVFNARCSPEQNDRALVLAKNLKKDLVAGSDAHLGREIGNVVAMLGRNLELKEQITNQLSSLFNVAISQIAGYLRRGEIIKLGCAGTRYVLSLLTNRNN